VSGTANVTITTPTLAAIADQTIPQGQAGTVTLQGSDPDGDPLTYSAVAQTLPYWLKQTYGLYEDAGGYYTNYRGQQEKYLRGTISANNYSDPNGYWYYILPNGDLFEFTPPYTNQALVGALVAHLGSAVYNDPSLLWNAQNTAVPTTLSISSNVLTITPNASYTGTFVVIASVSDGQASASRAFKVTVVGNVNSPPTLGAIPDQTIPAGQSGTVTLQGSDPDGDPLTYAAQAQALPYWLKQTYGIYEDAGGYYTNYRGQQEKYLRGLRSANSYSDPNGYWYYLLPNGDLFEFTPPYTNQALVGALVAHLGSAGYNDPSLLWNAQNTAVPASLSITSNVLTITPNSGYFGTFVVIASVSDGQASASQAFRVAVNAPPTLAPIPDQTIPAGQSGTVTLQGSDPDGDPLTYSAVAETLPYWLKQTYGIFQDPAGYYTNYRGQQEKYLRGTISADSYSDPNGYWYYILPNGDLYEFTPPYTNSALVGALVAHLGTAVYNDPSLLWNAQNTAVPTTLGIAGNMLTITPNAIYTGTFVVIASVSDGQFSTSKAFKVTVA
jgi:hypothetical protein